MSEIALTANERKVLDALGTQGGDYFYGFAWIATHTGLSRDDVRTACRSLAARGLAAFLRGLMNDDGEVAGSGYGLTATGWRLLEAVA